MTIQYKVTRGDRAGEVLKQHELALVFPNTAADWARPLSAELMRFLELEAVEIPDETPAVDPRGAVLAQIAQLERESMLNRGSRELELRLMEKEADALAMDQGTTREAVLATVPYYGKVKALDDQITALRVQL